MQDESEQEVTKNLQEAAITWEGELRATGGTLQPEKGFYKMVHFDWSVGLWTFNKHPTPPSILVPNDKGTNLSIDFKNTHKHSRH